MIVFTKVLGYPGWKAEMKVMAYKNWRHGPSASKGPSQHLILQVPFNPLVSAFPRISTINIGVDMLINVP